MVLNSHKIIGNLLAAIDPDQIQEKARKNKAVADDVEPSLEACDTGSRTIG